MDANTASTTSESEDSSRPSRLASATHWKSDKFAEHIDRHSSVQLVLQSLSRLDVSLSSHIHSMELGQIDWLFLLPAWLCGTAGMPIVLIGILLLFGIGPYHLALLSCLLTVALSEKMKKSFQRNRPQLDKIAKRVWNVRGKLRNYSMPSGDSAQAAVTTGSLLLLCRYNGGSDTGSAMSSWFSPNNSLATDIYCTPAWYENPAIMFVPLVMFGRCWFGAHFVGDCIVGVMLGFACTYLVYLLTADYLLHTEFMQTPLLTLLYIYARDLGYV